MSRYHDPFKPKPGETFSKRQVDKAGPLLRSFFSWDPSSDGPFDHPDAERLPHAFAAVDWWRSTHAQPLRKVAANLRHHLAREGALIDGRVDVTQRLKRTSTIGDKLAREPTMHVTQMQDVGGVRARVPSVRHVHAVSRRLKKSWTIQRTRDYIADPKPSGYRALHHIVRRDGYLVEVQLRTTLQDTWANQVEDDSASTGVSFKYGSGAPEVHEYYVAMSEAFATLDAGQLLSGAMAEELNRRYARIKDVLRGHGSTP